MVEIERARERERERERKSGDRETDTRKTHTARVGTTHTQRGRESQVQSNKTTQNMRSDMANLYQKNFSQTRQY